MATILCIDDDIRGLEIRKRLLEVFKFTVLVAFDKEHALQILKDVTVDLVLLDYHMPNEDGGSVARAIRAVKPAVKIVILSGDVMAPQLCEDCGADLFIIKGQMNPRAMIDVLLKLIGLKEI